MTRKSNTATDTIETTTEGLPAEENQLLDDIQAGTDEIDEPAGTEQQPETDLISPYKAAQLIEAELQITVPPQMVYTYVKNGAFGEEAKTTKRISPKDALDWARALDKRRKDREAKKQAA